MRKIVASLVAAMMMLFASVAFAYDGGILDHEQQTASTFTTSVIGAKADYAMFTTNMDPGMKAKYDVKGYNEYRALLNKEVGTVSDVKFVAFQRAPQADILTYIAKSNKFPVVQIQFAFNQKQELVAAAFTPFQIQQAAPQKK